MKTPKFKHWGGRAWDPKYWPNVYRVLNTVIYKIKPIGACSSYDKRIRS